jgi:multiple sugar transport system permease protein
VFGQHLDGPYVMLICLAGLRSIPDYIYEAAEVDRASGEAIWSITFRGLPFLMLAVHFRRSVVRVFDLSTCSSGGPGSTTNWSRSRSNAPRLGKRATPQRSR